MTRVELLRALLPGVLAVMAALATAVAAEGQARVVLGSPAGTPAVPHCLVKPSDCGWGTVAPHLLTYGGDLSSEVGHGLRWTGWGDREALGIGVVWTATPGGGMYPTPLPVRLRAFSIGRCQRGGPLAYRRLQIRAPDRPGGRMPNRWSDVHVPCALLGRS